MRPDAPDDTPEMLFKIELEDDPGPTARQTRSALVHPVPPQEALPSTLPVEESSLEAQPSSWRTVKHVVSRGFFDPFAAFGEEIDWAKFKKSQIFLTLTSLLGPLLFTLVMGFVFAIVHALMASLNSVTSPNTFFEVGAYPFIFILAKGYWIAYLVLPALVLVLGWVLAACTAWNLARDSEDDFKKMFCILAMLGAMFAPFTMFPFLRLVALAVLVWYTSRRMADHFEISFVHLLKRGGIFLLGCALIFSWSERKVESCYSNPSELSNNLSAFIVKKQKLEWPSFWSRKPEARFKALFEGIASFDPVVRDKSLAAATSIMNSSGETPETRFQVALRIAETGNPAGGLFVARAYQEGKGVPADSAKALAWIQKAVEANPKNLELALERANLLLVNKRMLEGKRLFVALAKENLDALDRIGVFIQAGGWGTHAKAFTYEIQRLYRMNSSDQGWGMVAAPAVRYTSRYYEDPDGYHAYTPGLEEGLSIRRDLLERISSQDQDGSKWFYRALVAEYGATGPASADVYGESASSNHEDLAEDKIDGNDPVALANAGNHFADQDDVIKAREYWLKAASALNSDKRNANASIYLKLAKSYDPAISPKAQGNARQATRFYLGYVLLDSTSGAFGQASEALKRLGTPISPELMNSRLAFIALCAKFDVPEAWVMTGSNCMEAGASKNVAKARECFQKAKALGYRGPAVN